MKKRNITRQTKLRLQWFNKIRMLRADIFALSNRDLLVCLKSSGRSNQQVADEMNKVGMQTNGGIPWNIRSVSRQIQRLQMLDRLQLGCQRSADAARPFELPALARLDALYHETLNLLYLGSFEDFRGDVIETAPYLSF